MVDKIDFGSYDTLNCTAERSSVELQKLCCTEVCCKGGQVEDLLWTIWARSAVGSRPFIVNSLHATPAVSCRSSSSRAGFNLPTRASRLGTRSNNSCTHRFQTAPSNALMLQNNCQNTPDMQQCPYCSRIFFCRPEVRVAIWKGTCSLSLWSLDTAPLSICGSLASLPRCWCPGRKFSASRFFRTVLLGLRKGGCSLPAGVVVCLELFRAADGRQFGVIQPETWLCRCACQLF